MSSITARLICWWCSRVCICVGVFVILCATTTTPSGIHAHPILQPQTQQRHQQQQPHIRSLQPRQVLLQDDSGIVPLTTAGGSPSTPSTPSSPPPTLASASPSSSSPALGMPGSKFVQKPLLQIIAPNVTLFAALDLPPSSSSSPSSASVSAQQPEPTGSAPESGSSLLLPTSSLTISQNQIYHVNDTLMFGAGGAQPLTVQFYPYPTGLFSSFPLYLYFSLSLFFQRERDVTRKKKIDAKKLKVPGDTVTLTSRPCWQLGYAEKTTFSIFFFRRCAE